MEALSSSCKELRASVARWYVTFWLEKVPCWISGLRISKCDGCSFVLCGGMDQNTIKISHLFTSSISFLNLFDFLVSVELRKQMWYFGYFIYDISHFYSINSVIMIIRFIYVLIDLFKKNYLFNYHFVVLLLIFYVFCIIPNLYVYIHHVNVCFISSEMFLGIEIRFVELILFNDWMINLHDSMIQNKIF